MSNLEKIKKIINFFSYLIFILYILILYRYREKIFEGLENLNNVLESRNDNYVALGNAVNSKLVYYIGKNLIK